MSATTTPRTPQPRRQPASGAFSTNHTLTGNDADMLTPNVAQHLADGALTTVKGQSALTVVLTTPGAASLRKLLAKS